LPPIDEVLNSVGKVRILSILAVTKELNITAITKYSGLNHSSVKDHLEELNTMDIIEETKFGRIRIYKMNRRSKAGKLLFNFFKEWYALSSDTMFQITE
jgi:predicted transcriptional regulator